MSTSHFKIPKHFQTPKSCNEGYDHTQYRTPIREMSDSEESTNSNPSDCGSTGSGSTGPELTIVAEFDDLMRHARQLRSNEIEDAFLAFVEQTHEMYVKYQMSSQECRRLQNVLDDKTRIISDLESKLGIARKFLDQEKKKVRKITEERDCLETQMALARDLLFKDNRNYVPDETREKLAFLNNTSRVLIDTNGGGAPHLTAIQEVNTTGSLLSDFSYSRSEDDLDVSLLHAGKSWKKHRPSTGTAAEPVAKKRRSSGGKVVEINTMDKVMATTTLTVTKDGPITATSIIESIPPEPGFPKTPMRDVYMDSQTPTNVIYNMWQQNNNKVPHNSNYRQHCLQSKTMVLPETCCCCDKRIRFGKTACKCKDCRAVCHIECKDQLPLPCIQLVNTPTQRGMLGVIGDYTPTTPPMVPAIIIHCVNEIELRGLNEVGIYRVPGSERDVKALKEKFLRGKGAPCLNQIDVHVVCGTVKDFLRSLTEPVVTRRLWKEFVRAAEGINEQDIRPALYQVISELPQPNRDTLAYMILHLQKVSKSVDCKMTLENLAKVFGPTIIGYSSAEPEPTMLFEETRKQFAVMEQLLKLPSDYWMSFINVISVYHTPIGKLQQTPSTDSLLRPTTGRGLFMPLNTRSTRKKQQKMFPTPPIK